MKYYNIEGENGLSYKNMIVLKNLNDYNDYIDTTFDVEIEKSQREIVQKIKSGIIGHASFNIAEVAMMTSRITGQGSAYLVAKIGSDIKDSQLKSILKGKSIAINSKGGFFELCEGDEIEIKTKYDESDIKISRWTGGVHYYAKIGHIDVVDSNNDIKWNTYKRAREVALEVLKNYS